MNHTLFIVCLIAAHFIGDWALQSRKMAMGKSSSKRILVNHISIVSLILLLVLIPFNVPATEVIVKLGINAIVHGIIDWNIWSFYKKDKPSNFEYWKDKGFYDTIALDQFLHLGTLAVLFL